MDGRFLVAGDGHGDDAEGENRGVEVPWKGAVTDQMDTSSSCKKHEEHVRQSAVVPVEHVVRASQHHIGSLADEVVLKILAFSDARSLARFAITSKAASNLQASSLGDLIWTERLWSDFSTAPRQVGIGIDTPPSDGGFVAIEGAKTVYGKRVMTRQTRLRKEKEDRQREEEQLVIRMKQADLRVRLITATSCYGTCCPAVLLLLLAILSMSWFTLRDENGVRARAAVHLIPLWLCIALLTFMFCIVRKAYLHNDRGDTVWGGHRHFVKETLYGIFVDACAVSKRRAVHALIMGALFALTPIMITIKVDVAPGMPWALTFWPVWFLIIGWLVVPCVHYEDIGSGIAGVIAMLCIFCCRSSPLWSSLRFFSMECLFRCGTSSSHFGFFPLAFAASERLHVAKGFGRRRRTAMRMRSRDTCARILPFFYFCHHCWRSSSPPPIE